MLKKMKFIITIALTLFFFCTQFLFAQERTVAVSVVNLSSNKGNVILSLFHQEDFLRKPIQSEISVVQDSVSNVVFKAVPPGEYAIVCYHDENENGKMDFQPNGIPVEAYGASNNILRFGPPQFEDAKFRVRDKNVSLEIKL